MRSTAAVRPLDTNGFAERSRANRSLEAFLCDYVHSASKQPLQAKLEPREVQQGSATLERDEKIHIASVSFVSTGDGAEYPDLLGATRRRSFENLRAVLLEVVAEPHAYQLMALGAENTE